MNKKNERSMYFINFADMWNNNEVKRKFTWFKKILKNKM